MCLYMHTKPAIPPQKYNKLLKDNITKSYKKLADLLEIAINLEAKNIAWECHLSDRIECLTRTSDFSILKDHLDNF